MKANIYKEVTADTFSKHFPRGFGDKDIVEVGNYRFEEKGFLGTEEGSLLVNDAEEQVLRLFRKDEQDAVSIKKDVIISEYGNTTDGKHLKHVEDLVEDEGMDGEIVIFSDDYLGQTIFNTDEEYLFTDDASMEKCYDGSIYSYIENEDVRVGGKNSEFWLNVLKEIKPPSYDDFRKSWVSYRKALVDDGEDNYQRFDDYLEGR